MEESQNTTQTKPEQLTLALREQQEDEIDLVELFYLLWGHVLQIIVCVIVGGATAFVVTYFLMTPQYQATAKMYMVSASNSSIVNLSDLQLGTQLTLDYQELLLSRPLLEDVINALELDMLPEVLSKSVSIENPEGTRILSITVTSFNPQLSADIANTIVEQAVLYLPRIMETPSPNIYEDATVPMQKSSPSYSRNTLLGAMLVVVIYCGFLIVRYLMDDSFTTPEDINRCFGIQPLAVVPEGDFRNSKSRHTKLQENKHRGRNKRHKRVKGESR